MPVLDCETRDTCLQSLAALFQITEDALRERFAGLPTAIRPEEMYERISGRKVGTIVPDVVCWFHSARVRPDTRFDEGLLPARKQVDEYWPFLRTLAQWVSDDEWERFRNATTPILQKNFERIGGPGGLLFPSLDYPGTPAPPIVRNICNDFLRKYERDLLPAYASAMSLCLVKFRSCLPRPDTVMAALQYVYASSRGIDSCYQPVFDGKGTAVPREDILKVEFFETPPVHLIPRISSSIRWPDECH